MKRTLTISLVLSLFLITATAQTNLLDDSTWTEGNGSSPGFNRYGADANSVRAIGQAPGGEDALLWTCVPDDNNSNDGGWQTSRVSIDATVAHRFTVWIKKTGNDSGLTRFALNAWNGSNAKSVSRLDGSTNNNPFMFTGDLPTVDKWYLMVGIVHEIGFTGTTNEGGIYDPLTGTKVAGITDYKYQAGTVQTQHRVFLREVTDNSVRQFQYAPRLEALDGTEPSIQDIIDALYNTTPPTGGSNWTKTGSDISYTDGNVGIGTDSPDAPLTVRGRIHTQEVKVDLAGAVAPDYVFYKNYDLKSLEEIASYISNEGHLPNIPSAAEMQENGVNLKEMNLKLLEKVEEHTLYLIEQQQSLKEQKAANSELNERLAKLESILDQE